MKFSPNLFGAFFYQYNHLVSQLTCKNFSWGLSAFGLAITQRESEVS